MTTPSAVKGAEQPELSLTPGGNAHVQPLGKMSWNFLIKSVIYNGIIKKKPNDKHTTQMNHKCIMFYEISQPQKAAHSMILFI